MRAGWLLLVLGLVGCANEPADEAADVAEQPLDLGFVDTPNLTAAERDAILAKYEAIPHAGIRTELYEKTILYYDTNLSKLPNKAYVSIIDFSLHSGKRRLFVLDMAGGPMKGYVVAHGTNSDPDNDGYATSFSNVVGSNQSSLGFYYVAERYTGSFGDSMRLDGLSPTNSNARTRAIVMHAQDSVVDGKAKQGRSYGCPAVSQADRPEIVEHLKEGSLLYASN
jgi:hypothetical protein